MMRACVIAVLGALLMAVPLSAQDQGPYPRLPGPPVKSPPDTSAPNIPGVVAQGTPVHLVRDLFHSTEGPIAMPDGSLLFTEQDAGDGRLVKIDRDDNIWTVDKGSDMVVKFNPAGRVQMVFGRRMESTSPNTKPHAHVTPPRPAVDGLFREPTDVAWDREGNIYITDGYINSRVAKYTSTGDWVKQWGEYGMEPGQFRTPHAIAIDNNNHIYVGDRSNTRVQVFDTDGKFLRSFTLDVPPAPGTKSVYGNTATGARLAELIGAPNAICITPGEKQVMFVGELTFPGRILKVSLDGKVLGVIGRSGRNLKQFSGGHQLACPNENEIYVAETANWRVQKLILK